MSVASNLARIQEQIAAACRQANRSESEVALMAVSKMHPAEAIQEAFAAGVRLFGENRVQEWQEKRTSLQPLFDPAKPDSAKIHLIGPLQSNKTTKAAEMFDTVDTVDSSRIASRLNSTARELGKKLPILIEVKLSREESKHGIAPDRLLGLVDELRQFESLIPSGLMTVPPWSEDPEIARPYFRELRGLRDSLLPAYPALTQLSMGMSNDFAVAIDEGSNCLRIGTALFGKRQYADRAGDADPQVIER